MLLDFFDLTSILGTLQTIVSFIVILGFLVFFHELGHYLVARRNGIIVDEFGMGYPPRLVKLFTYDGTEFTLNLIPFGGFARMRGEDAADMGKGTFNAASRGGRAATLIAGPAMNALLAILLFAASFMDGFPAAAASPQIATDTDPEVLAPYALEPSDILLTLDNKPIYMPAFDDLDYTVTVPESTDETAAENILLVSRQDELVELAFPADRTLEELLQSVDTLPVLGTKITLIAEESPALESGLLAGDLFYRVDGITIDDDENSLINVIREVAGTEVPVTVLRGEEWVTVNVKPRTPEETPTGEGSLGVGISGVSQLASLPLLPSLWEGTKFTFSYFWTIIKLPYMIFAGQVAASDAEFTGPVGIAQMVGGAVDATMETGFRYPIWRLSAILSAALAITNMLPLPALDGGRLLFILIETIRGRRVSPEREGMVHMLGFVFLLGLIVFITVRDITGTREAINWMEILGQ